MRQGTQVICNGYRGALVRRYSSDPEMWEVRVPGGLVAVGRSEFTVIDEPSTPIDLPACQLCGGAECYRELFGVAQGARGEGEVTL